MISLKLRFFKVLMNEDVIEIVFDGAHDEEFVC